MSMQAELDLVARRLCFHNRTAWNRKLNAGCRPRVTTDFDELERYLQEEYERLAGWVIHARAAENRYKAFEEISGIPIPPKYEKDVDRYLRWAETAVPIRREPGRLTIRRGLTALRWTRL